VPPLRLAAVRRAVAFLEPVPARTRPGDGSPRLPLTLAGAALLVLAAAGALTLNRTQGRMPA
jgi:hypothetical protein